MNQEFGISSKAKQLSEELLTAKYSINIYPIFRVILFVTFILMFTPLSNHNLELYKYTGDMMSTCLTGRNGKQDKEDGIKLCLGV